MKINTALNLHRLYTYNECVRSLICIQHCPSDYWVPEKHDGEMAPPTDIQARLAQMVRPWHFPSELRPTLLEPSQAAARYAAIAGASLNPLLSSPPLPSPLFPSPLFPSPFLFFSLSLLTKPLTLPPIYSNLFASKTQVQIFLQ